MKIKLRWNLLVLALAVIIVLASVRSAGAGVYRLAGDSMAPGLRVGDVVLVNKMAFDLRVPFTEQVFLGRSDPLRSDVVLVSIPAPGGGTIPAFKRVVGLAGDEIEIRNCRLIVDGREARYEFAKPVAAQTGAPREKIETFGGRSYPVLWADDACEAFGPAVVPPERYFLLGDNRSRSRDSRHFGPLTRSAFRGRVAAVLSKVATP